jgi:murein DD-endopeptidase MepM/ murein hydrolase activator NlpD
MALENLGTIEDIVSNDNLTETSMSSDLTVKKASSVKENKVNTNINTGSKNTNKIDKTPVESKVTNTTVTNVVESSLIEENVKKELKFESPVSGEIIKDFAMDNLIYSNTLEEWTTHLGIDIKADKTSIVTASEKGIVESIKNDPRFGLTITISHEDGFKTIYSNLLTSEFVTENEEVEKGQTIGTIGETASFEISDEPHLHFEMYKDEEPVNPTIYLK